MTGSPATPDAPVTSFRDGDMLAAIDIGSNSFHMVVARYTLGQLRIVDRLRETVRMAEGLDAAGNLHPDAMRRALGCLARFGQRLRGIPPANVRALATNTVRAMATPKAFLVPAESALGHPIEVISGREEARLIYLGVAHAEPPRPGQRRLVIDIGGGSTECIIGTGFEPIERESLQAGCIAITRRHFPDGRLSAKRWHEAVIAVSAEFQQFASAFVALGWHEVLGASGTNKAISGICASMKLTKGAITAEALPQVRDRLLKSQHIDDIDLPGLPDERRPIIAGGLVVLEAAFAVLGLQRMLVSRAALREGILYDMLGRGGGNDPRELSIAALVERYGIDEAQAQRVHDTAMRLFAQVRGPWELDEDDALKLGWAARLHEIGLTVAHSQYHVHGAYLLEHSDIAGFSRQEQQALSALVRCHRRKVPKHAFDALPDRLLLRTRRVAALLRLAVVLHRSRSTEPLPRLELRADGDRLELVLGRPWLDAHPLLRSDLQGETEGMARLGIDFRVTTT